MVFNMDRRIEENNWDGFGGYRIQVGIDNWGEDVIENIH